jgi:hypothetical protein
MGTVLEAKGMLKAAGDLKIRHSGSRDRSEKNTG